MASEERLRELEEEYEDYKVYDNRGDKIGKVDDLFVDENDQPEYIGVKLGLLGRKSTLIPMEIVRVNEADKTIEVSESKDHVEDAPSFDDDEEITGDYERRIRDHFGLESTGSSSSSGGYGSYAGGGTGEQERDDSQEDYSSEAGTTEGGGSSETSSEGATSGQSLGGTGPSETGSSEGETRGASTSRQTEETETYQEGGRTKVRRRIVREEVVDADEE